MTYTNDYTSALSAMLDTRSMISDEDLRVRMEINYKYEICNIIGDAIKLKFPNIKYLVVDYSGSFEEQTINVQFQEDEIHTRKTVEDYINQMKDECSKFKV